MAQQIERLTIFLASPGDVAAEREQVREAVEAINRTIGRDRNVHIDVVGWDTDARPAFGGDGQSIINVQLADMDKYDLFVGIMWNRFGAPTPRAGSGTEEEFSLAAEANRQLGRPEIMFYFSQQAANLTTEEQAEQKLKVLQFKRGIRVNGLTWDYDSVQQFRTLIQDQLSSWLLNRTPQVPRPPSLHEVPTHTAPSAVETSTVLAPNANSWVLLSGTFFVAESLSIDAGGALTLFIKPRDAEEEAILSALDPQQYRHGGPVNFAYQNNGGLVQVQKVEFKSQGGETVITVSAQPADSGQGGFMDMAFNGTSADEIATLRARLILLNAPVSSGFSDGAPFLQHFISGSNAAVRLEKGIFPDFWKHMVNQPQLFVPLARLLAVFYLKASNTVEHVLELSLGPVSGTRLTVKFRGQRKRIYTNVQPAVIEVVGECELS